MTVEFEIGWRALAAFFMLAVVISVLLTDTRGK
jgi:hypothetical protein